VTRLSWTGSALVVVSTFVWVMAPAESETSSVVFAAPKEDKADRGKPSDAKKWRDDAVRRVRVWWPVEPSSLLDLSKNPIDRGGQLSQPIVSCRFLAEPPRATTPKFSCSLPDGEVVKVKYGSNREVYGEVAGTRLLAALGFGADEMFVVPRVRCYGCPRFPFETMWVLDHVGARKVVSDHLPDSRYTDFEWAAVERRFPGKEIEVGHTEGWAWYELDRVDQKAGASRDELDALRLAAVMLAHWDNKAANQRLVCVAPLEASGRCPQPVAIIHDLGATFGPHKVDFGHWAAAPVWADASRCRVSMRHLPYEGGTFPDVEISEGGRALLVRQLEALDEHKIRAIFRGARFKAPEAWARAFQEKVRQIKEAGPCGSENGEIQS